MDDLHCPLSFVKANAQSLLLSMSVQLKPGPHSIGLPLFFLGILHVVHCVDFGPLSLFLHVQTIWDSKNVHYNWRRFVKILGATKYWWVKSIRGSNNLWNHRRFQLLGRVPGLHPVYAHAATRPIADLLSVIIIIIIYIWLLSTTNQLPTSIYLSQSTHPSIIVYDTLFFNYAVP